MSARVDEISLRVRFDSNVAPNVPALVEPIFEAHAGVLRRGGFSNPRISAEPELTVTVEGSAASRDYFARARSVDRGAWRVLLNAIRGELWLKDLTSQVDVQCSLVTEDSKTMTTGEIE